MDKLNFKYNNILVEIIMDWFCSENYSVSFNVKMISPKEVLIDTVEWINKKGQQLYLYKTAKEVAETRTLAYIKKFGLE